MKRSYFISMVIVILGASACTNNVTVSTEKDSIAYNDHIQNRFFDVPFGATKEEVIKGFLKHDLYLSSSQSSSRLEFHEHSFGDMNWDYIYVNLSNNRFSSIEFFNTFKTKQSAMREYTSVLSLVSTKYNINNVTISDTTIYGLNRGVTKDGQWVGVMCYSYESTSHDKWIGVTLAYGDNNYNVISDEL